MKKNWSKGWKKISGEGEVGLYFVCPDCAFDTLLSPSSVVEVGTPICPDCETEMDYEATYVKKDK